MTPSTLDMRTRTTAPDIEEAAAWLAHFRPRLRTCLFGHPHPAKIKPMEDNAHCPLGRWLSHKGAGHPRIANLHALHEELHTHAREVLHAARRGEKSLASRLLEPGMPFTRTLHEAQSALDQLRGKVAEA